MHKMVICHQSAIMHSTQHLGFARHQTCDHLVVMLDDVPFTLFICFHHFIAFPHERLEFFSVIIVIILLGFFLLLFKKRAHEVTPLPMLNFQWAHRRPGRRLARFFQRQSPSHRAPPACTPHGCTATAELPRTAPGIPGSIPFFFHHPSHFFLGALKKNSIRIQGG